MIWDGFTGGALYLDTNILVFAVEEGNPWTAMLAELFGAIDARAVHTFTSELTIAEVLAKPIEVGAVDLIEKYDRLLSTDSLIQVVPIERSILRSAAELQGRLRIKLADAIHAATALERSCDFFLTNDERLGAKLADRMKWVSLPEVSSRPQR